LRIFFHLLAFTSDTLDPVRDFVAVLSMGSGPRSSLGLFFTFAPSRATAAFAGSVAGAVALAFVD
jgi:hypothetical protein